MGSLFDVCESDNTLPCVHEESSWRSISTNREWPFANLEKREVAGMHSPKLAPSYKPPENPAALNAGYDFNDWYINVPTK